MGRAAATTRPTDSKQTMQTTTGNNPCLVYLGHVEQRVDGHRVVCRRNLIALEGSQQRLADLHPDWGLLEKVNERHELVHRKQLSMDSRCVRVGHGTTASRGVQMTLTSAGQSATKCLRHVLDVADNLDKDGLQLRVELLVLLVWQHVLEDISQQHVDLTPPSETAYTQSKGLHASRPCKQAS